MTSVGIHVGIIPDGNRRWCCLNNVPLLNLPAMLQKMFEKSVQDVLRGEFNNDIELLRNIKEISLYVLSKDNLMKRDGQDDTIEMVREVLKILIAKVENYSLSSIVFKIVGEIALLPDDIREMCQHICKMTELGSRSRDSVVLCSLALAYDPKVDCKIERDIDSMQQSDIDLVIRTGGELRSSGFFPLHTLYSEWIYLPTLFPDMTLGGLNDAIRVYNGRQRRFGA